MKLLLATDGSVGSVEAARVAARVADAFDAEITVIHAIRPDDKWAVSQAGSSDNDGDPLDFFRDSVFPAVRGILDDAGIAYEEVLLTDPAAQGISNYARDHNIDFIVVGHQGHGALKRLLAGSTARSLIDLAPCPTLVVPDGGRHMNTTDD